MVFENEADFEEALIANLKQHGWDDESGVLKHPTEKDLLQNWADILFENNREIDRLNNCPLTEGEMQQILEKIAELRTPVALNGFINGKTVAIKRDNPEDTLHYEKEVSLKIYDRLEIAAGQSRYQIARQPHFETSSEMFNQRRGDLMLLINGMPVIHIELKRSGIPVSQACNQIAKYMHEGVYCGIFSLVQIFVAMEPNETVYFANPGPDGNFNKDFYFHWADFNNNPLNDWKDVAKELLNIPMAHQLIGFYTVADDTDGTLKVMRSYQYFAASRISARVAQAKWDLPRQKGGYIWHTTGSGKTLTSFKAAQLIADSQDADKVIFLVDRIELGTQSLSEYRGFADDDETVQQTENTNTLLTKLKSTDPADTLIVTSIQKMSRVTTKRGVGQADLEKIAKRLVFIIDECHRSTFGEMLIDIRQTFPYALFFGFTGTPIHEENSKKQNTTTSVFGDELHRYSIADGIRDKNVLGFDPYMICTYKDTELRKSIALEKAKASSVEEVFDDPDKAATYYTYMDTSKTSMVEIEKLVPRGQYECEEHREAVVENILENWVTLSRNNKFHAIFATCSIQEAIAYYRLFKQRDSNFKVTALFDPSIDNTGDEQLDKEDGLAEIIEDYNRRFNQGYTIATHSLFKKDIAARLAHKKPYLGLDRKPKEQLNLVIVVNQMLTGFDSKWINTLYLDKVLQYEGVIQAFSRTNRLFGPEKPFGTIRYYRKPYTMSQNIEDAVKLYSGDRPLGLFVDQLDANMAAIESLYEEIYRIFKAEKIKDFKRLPKSEAAIAEFAKTFKELNERLEAAKIQGFTWQLFQETTEYSIGLIEEDRPMLDESVYDALLQRYKEIPTPDTGTDGGDTPFDIDTYITEIDTGRIDTDYMNANFSKWLKAIANNESTDALESELHRSFASLSQEEQKYADLILHDVQSGDIEIEKGKTFRDYLNDYQCRAKNERIIKLVDALGIDPGKLNTLMTANVSGDNLNEHGRFDALKNTVDKEKARSYFQKCEGKSIPPFKVNERVDRLLRDFILRGGFDIDEYCADQADS